MIRRVSFFVRITLYGSTQFSNKMYILFYCRKKIYSIYTSKGVGSFSTPGLKTCTILAIERKQGLQCYTDGELGLGFMSVVVYHCI